MAKRIIIEHRSSLPVEETNEWMRDVLNEFVTDKAFFISYSPKYSDPYETDLETLIDTAKNVVPDATHVYRISELTNKVEAKLDICRIELQKLFRFVVDIFPKSPARLNQSGKNDYEAARKSPEKMLVALKIAKMFADENAAALTAKGYTPAMADNLITTRTDLENALIAQIREIKIRPVDTELRRTTVNEAYDEVRNLCEDAKIIFVNDFAMYNKYLLPGIDKGSVIHRTVSAMKTKNVLHREFTAESKLLIKNLEAADLYFGLSPDENSPVDNLIIPGNTDREVSGSELGDIGYHFLNVTNKDSVITGKFSVKIL